MFGDVLVHDAGIEHRNGRKMHGAWRSGVDDLKPGAWEYAHVYTLLYFLRIRSFPVSPCMYYAALFMAPGFSTRDVWHIIDRLAGYIKARGQ